MPFPKKVKVGPIAYKIQEVNGLKGQDGESYFGMVRFSDETIFIEANISETQKQQTLIHEILHVIMTHMGMREHDENLIDGISYGLLDVFLANPSFRIPMLEKKA